MHFERTLRITRQQVWCSVPSALELCAQIGQNWWLSVWSDATLTAEAAGGAAPGQLYLAVYFVLGVASLAAQFTSGVFLAHGHLNATKELYNGLVTKVCSTFDVITKLPMSSYRKGLGSCL